MSEQEEHRLGERRGAAAILQAVADGGEEIEAEPTGRTDGDVTMWEYDDASGQEIGKTYADGGRGVKTYDAFGNLAAETNARGVVKTMAYDTATGELTGVSFSDGTPERSFAYNVQGQVTEVKDAAGTRRFGYNEYGDPETERSCTRSLRSTGRTGASARRGSCTGAGRRSSRTASGRDESSGDADDAQRDDADAEL